jgi:rhamnogalacturonyl hydrolase YesR
MANWVTKYLQTSSNLYNNSLNNSGIDTNLWAYNQGVMIGANVLWYQLTNTSAYLASAVSTANSALSHYGNFDGIPPSYNSMLFQNLLQLYPYASSTLQASIINAAQSYGDWAWNNTAARDPKTNVFYFNDAGQPVRGSSQAAQLRDQGAMTQLYAILAWNSSDYGKLT